MAQKQGTIAPTRRWCSMATGALLFWCIVMWSVSDPAAVVNLGSSAPVVSIEQRHVTLVAQPDVFEYYNGVQENLSTFWLRVTLPNESYRVAYVGGDPDGFALRMPPAYHVSPAYSGVDIGGVSPAYWPVINNQALGHAEFDSWLTIGNDGSYPVTDIAHDIENIDQWTLQYGLYDDSHGVFMVNATHPRYDLNRGGSGPILIAKITIGEAYIPGNATATVRGTFDNGDSITTWSDNVLWQW